jgi:hypothetical protein
MVKSTLFEQRSLVSTRFNALKRLEDSFDVGSTIIRIPTITRKSRKSLEEIPQKLQKHYGKSEKISLRFHSQHRQISLSEFLQQMWLYNICKFMGESSLTSAQCMTCLRVNLLNLM